MAQDFESAKGKIQELVAWASVNDYGLRRNEAATRLHLIDTILFDCLGWEKENCPVEDLYDGKFADYILGKPELYAVLEAKRENIYFELPAGFSNRIVKLPTILESSDEVRKALEQVLGYCQKRGIGVGVVSNGHQLIAFLASRQDGVPPFEGTALVFASLESMRDDFRTFWDNLSHPGFKARNIYSSLRELPVQPPPQKLSQRLPEYPGFKGRNPFQTELQILGEIVLEDIAQERGLEKEFLERCYCTSGALSQYALVSKQILQTRYSSVLQQELELPNIRAASEKSGISRELATDLTAAAVTQRPVILLGDVGVGKTIFLGI